MARRPPLRRAIAIALAVILCLAGGAVLAAWSGAYNIAASRGHWRIVEWFLAFGMRNSVALRARGIEVPALDDPALHTLGAAHFHSGCAFCHGAPGVRINPVPRHMLPPPPDLADAAVKWNDRELFWIVKHGIKYTGMPAWVSQHRDDEVWAVVAFLKRLPALDARGYQTLALGGLQVAAQSGRELATTEGAAEAVSACARCHGAEGRRPASKFVPVLHGQPRAFLAAALEAYASDKRASGMMQPVASDLASDAVQKVAAFYAGLPPPPPDQTAADPQAVTRGQTLARDGRPGARIPECLSCHGEGALQTYPRLAGQNAAYVAGRLHRWKRGIAAATDTEAIMAPIAQLLSDQEIQDLSAYFASLRPRAK